MGVMRPELIMKSIMPVVMAEVLGIYGLIIAVIISMELTLRPDYLVDGCAHLSSGLTCDLAGISTGMAIKIVGDAGVGANAQQPKLFIGMILILIFAEALSVYGLIIGIIISSHARQSELIREVKFSLFTANVRDFFISFSGYYFWINCLPKLELCEA